ncbi:mucin-15 [Danio aesculapii]|uniref:mucin-15 n=1 Tax=Danio aesculapii TaxID=1142201 RepID=UPI0024C08F7B|nr:mucin-15 [Danio aesculapii]
MKSLLAITLSLLLILQSFQQVSGAIPKEWERSNEAIEDNETQPSSLETTDQPMGGSMEDTISIEDTQPFPSSSENEDQPIDQFLSGGESQEQNSTQLDQNLDQSSNETEEGSSEGLVFTPPPSLIPFNSSTEMSNTTAESNETLNANTSAPNSTNITPKPENITTESNFEKSGSENLTTNSTTESPATTTEEVSIQNKTTESPTEAPTEVPENATTPVLDNKNIEANLTIDTRESSERGSSSDTVTEVSKNKNGQAWAVVLILGVIVGVIALGAFIFLNRKNRRDFSHSKLVEETSPDPVLRLDNSEPLDLKYDGFGYYNPGLQGDNIQMTNFPQGRSK